IVKRTGMSVSDTLSVLLSLELKGVVKQVVNHFYIRVLDT
ncbi:MAG: DNA-protecting protein DprA, partial [Lachnospiraceae bacterium]|nr:DNA-protecting protein DprA [Lachnospiraceae bacterium]